MGMKAFDNRAGPMMVILARYKRSHLHNKTRNPLLFTFSILMQKHVTSWCRLCCQIIDFVQEIMREEKTEFHHGTLLYHYRTHDKTIPEQRKERPWCKPTTGCWNWGMQKQQNSPNQKTERAFTKTNREMNISCWEQNLFQMTAKPNKQREQGENASSPFTNCNHILI